MLDGLLTNLELILSVSGVVFLLGLMLGVLRFVWAKPSCLRWRVIGVVFLFVMLGLLATLRSGPGGKEATPQELDPNREIDLSLTAIERLKSPWHAYDDPRWPVVETLAEISDIAYDPSVFATDRYEKMGFKHCYTVLGSSMVGYIVTADDVAVVVFRGTDFHEWSDWGVNKAVSPAPTEHGDIHSGFDNAYGKLSPQVNELLSRLKPKHLWITGHSLGGALASVCAYRIESKGDYSIQGLVTFGQPMIARLDLAKHLDVLFSDRYAWFVNGKDIVPKTPLGYEPAGSLVHLNDTLAPGRWRRKQVVYTSNGEYGSPRAEAIQVSPLPPMTEVERNTLREQLRAEPPPAFGDVPRTYTTSMPEIDQHLMGSYILSIQKLLGSGQPNTR